MYMDRTTEAIAHFIGLFAITLEQAQQRQAYEPFDHYSLDPDPYDLPEVDTDFSTSYKLLGFQPDLAYQPLIDDISPETVATFIFLDLPKFAIGLAAPVQALPFLSPDAFGTFMVEWLTTSKYRLLMPQAEVLGSAANYFLQGIELSDNDYFGVGAHGLKFSPAQVGDASTDSLLQAAAQFTPFQLDSIAGSAEELAAFANSLPEILAGFAPEAGEGQSVFVAKETTIEGIFVNGVAVDEAPKLEDHFSFEDLLESEPHSDDPLPPNAVLTDGGWEIDASVKVETGGNVLINNVLLKNLWTAANVTAVLGNHIEINAIIQINAWCDIDTVTTAIAGWDKAPLSTQAFNIAKFERTDPSEGEPAADPGAMFPKHWVIKQVTGDLMIVNWFQQFTYMRDNDIGVLSSSGVTTAVYSGQNIAYNDISLFELGFGYDLIIVGGNVYDLNIIEQLNLLFDNDLIGALPDFATTGDGACSTSGNLLWNYAHIYNVGGAARFETLPDAYRALMDALAEGSDALNDGVLSDPAFAGLGALRVLYITGDMINVQYAKMTNILADGDQIALAMDAAGAHPEAEWSVTTGGNALINSATILDLDALGKTYVGGEQYSQDVLVQTDIISTDPYYGAQNPDMLVSEAIFFLDDDSCDATEIEGGTGSLDPDNAHGDALQTLIG